MGLTKVNSGGIEDGSIVNADLKSDAAIAGSKLADNAVGLAQMAGGTDGQIITYDASGDPVAVGPGTDGQVLTSTGAGSPPAFEDASAGAGKNIIINGAQMIDQRNSGASVTMSASATFITDRFKCWEDTDGGLTAQQTSDAPAGFKRSLKFTVTSADSSIGASQYAMLRYPVEGYDMEDQNWGTSSAGTLTLSFWIKCSVTGTFGGGFVNSGDNRSYPFTYTVSSADTWEKKTVTVAGDQTGTWNAGSDACCNIHWSFGIGSNSQGTAGQWQAGNKYTATGETQLLATNGATWYLTGIQFERGSSATDFEYRSYGDELARCLRYFQVFNQDKNNAYYTYGTGPSKNTNTLAIILYLRSPMRVQPSLTVVGSTRGYNYEGYTAQSASGTISISTDHSDNNTLEVSVETSGTGFNSARQCLWQNENDADAHLLLNAEI